MEIALRQPTVVSKNIKTGFFFALFLVSTVLYIFVKFYSPALVEFLFSQGDFELLNRITGARYHFSLEYYLGKMHEKLFGPLEQIISGLLFTILCFCYLKDIGKWKFGLAVFVYLVLTKFEVLFFPPYGDAIGGPFAEAIFLKRHNFNYPYLFDQDGYDFGGPRVYMFSIYPTYLAALMKFLPTQFFLVVNHLNVFAMSAVIVTLLREMLAKLYRSDIATLGGVLLLFFPVFQSQTEAINMEIPSTLFITLSAYALFNRRIHLAGGMAIIAVLVKGTGVFACAAFLGMGILLLCFHFFGLSDKKNLRFKLTILLWGIGLIFLALIKVYSKFLVNDQHASQGMLSPLVGWSSLKQFDLTRQYLISVLITVGVVIYNYVKNKRTERLYEASVMFVFGGMWFLLFLNFYAVSPRYRVAVYPFLVFCAIYAICLLVKFHYVRKICLFAVIVLALYSSYGAYTNPITENDHVMLERSLEYRNDLKLNLKIVKILEEKFSDFKIGAPFILAQMLALPELGYVKKDLDVMIYGFDCRYEGIQNFPGIKKLDIAKTIYVGVKVVQLHKNLSYPIHPNDRIIHELELGDKKAWLFMGGISIDSVLRASNMIKLKGLLEMNRK